MAQHEPGDRLEHVAKAAEQLADAADTLRDIGQEIADIFELQAFKIEATMQDATVVERTLYAESWQAAGRHAQMLFPDARNILVKP
jgi:hypothetical protein